MLTLSRGLEGSPAIYGNRYGGVMTDRTTVDRKCLCEPNQTYNSGLNSYVLFERPVSSARCYGLDQDSRNYYAEVELYDQIQFLHQKT